MDSDSSCELFYDAWINQGTYEWAYLLLASMSAAKWLVRQCGSAVLAKKKQERHDFIFGLFYDVEEPAER